MDAVKPTPCAKVAYGSLLRALRVCAFWRRHPDARDPHALTPFRCASCGAWHVGHGFTDSGPLGKRASYFAFRRPTRALTTSRPL